MLVGNKVCAAPLADVNGNARRRRVGRILVAPREKIACREICKSLLETAEDEIFCSDVAFDAWIATGV